MNTEINQLPESFVIEQKRNNPLWREYIKWFNVQSKPHVFNGDNEISIFYGRIENDWCCWSKNELQGAELITLEQWDEIINKNEETFSNWYITIKECGMLIDGSYASVQPGCVFHNENFSKNYDRKAFREATKEEIENHLLKKQSNHDENGNFTKDGKVYNDMVLRSKKEETKYCSECIREWDKDDLYCPRCGHNEGAPIAPKQPKLNIGDKISEVDALIQEHERGSKEEKTGQEDHKIRTGFRVFGKTTEGDTHLWHFDTIDMAKKFCENICLKTNSEYDIMSYEGSVTPTTKFISKEQLKILGE